MNNYLKSALLLLSISAVAVSCKKKKDPEPVTPTVTSAEVHMNFKNYAGNDALQLNSGTYTTAQGESITISKFNYYISNIKLTATDGSVYTEPESYHLMQQEKLGSLHFHLEEVPLKTYNKVTFMVGVDEARNTSGAQTGDLDPVNGMFWTWNTGYIMAKMEGTSPQSTDTTNHSYKLHIGGFKGDYNAVKEVTLTFPTPVTLAAGSSGELVIKADALKWFAPSAIKLSEGSEIMIPSARSKSIADNYAQMFTLQSAVQVTE